MGLRRLYCQDAWHVSFALARLFYATTWNGWSVLARKMRPGNRREQYLSYYGPLSLLFLLMIWAVCTDVRICLVGMGITSTPEFT